MSRFDELRERACEANKAIVAAGLVVLTFGNVSVADRDEGVMAIKPSGVSYDALDPRSMVVVDLDTWEVVEGELRPSSDTPTHLVLYREFDSIAGIVHTHSPSATAWAQAGRDLPCFGTTHADHFHGPVPATRPLVRREIETRYEERTGDVIIETFRDRALDPLDTPAVLVVSHGPFAWAREVEGAVENAVALEAVASMALDTLALARGTKSVSDDLLDRHFSRKHGASAYYGQVD